MNGDGSIWDAVGRGTKPVRDAVRGTCGRHPHVVRVLGCLVAGPAVCIYACHTMAPVVVVETVSEYGWGVVDVPLMVVCYAVGVALMAAWGTMLGWTHGGKDDARRGRLAVYAAALLAAVLAPTLLYPEYSGPDGLDYVGQALGTTLMHVYGGTPIGVAFHAVAVAVWGVLDRTGAGEDEQGTA